jgi:hypothetical protein
VVDPKPRHFHFYRGATVVTPNQLETEHGDGLRLSGPAGARGGRAAAILSRLGCRAVLVSAASWNEPVRARQPARHVPALGARGVRRDAAPATA